MEPTYESIKSIITSEIWTGNQVSLKFKAPNQEQPLETMGVAIPNQEEMMKKMAAEMAKMTASSMAVNTAGNLLGNLTGFSGAGSVINSAAGQMGVGYQMDPNKLMQVDLTNEVKEETILNAFKTLINFYKFENNEWLYKI
jgi:hypothetical protein